MKKYLCLVIALLLLLSACGKNKAPAPAPAPEAPAADGVPVNPEPAPEEEEKKPEPVQNEVKEPEPVHPYEWLGLSGMPDCSYLDTICTNHYYQVYDSYTPEGKQEVIDAADGVDALQVKDGLKNLTVGGMIYQIDDAAKTYTMDDMSELVSQAKSSLDYALENGTNMTGRAFQDTGRSAVPLYAEAEGDSAEYEYYEFLISNPGVSEQIERFFMKDGDVFAIYSATTKGESTEESTKVIRSVTADIPAGTFAVPDLSDYTKAN